MDQNNTSQLPDIRHTILLDAPISRVWEAVATSEGIAAWFMPNTFQPVEGFEFVLHAGPFGDSPCKVTVLDPPHRLSFHWGKDWTLTFELEEKGDQTEFTLIHSGWSADQVTEFGQKHEQVRGNMDQGWAGMVGKLANYVRV
ncbi:SRPBCC family protein [Paenibacillus phocaensis]|uniref:SRPBCC family protein n=1 Tax=Paenibacillus phocaensis TaxID=1776378 RepID=UPI0003A16F19|nr:SRPBCC domain-containing protein [Paenibacillus phocaensis]